MYRQLVVFCVADPECPGETHVSFDFNTVLEDSRREKEVEKQMANGECLTSSGPSVDYKMKEG